MPLKNIKHELKDLDNVSVTALRIISILDMLLKEPLSDSEINQKLQENIKDSRALSKDTICIYINTLRAIGCEILRPTKNNEYKYILKSNPFKLNFSQEEINSLIEVRKYISTLGNWKLAVEMDDLFCQLHKQMNQESKKLFTFLKKADLCREIDIKNFSQDIDLIEKYCNENQNIMILYNSPNSGEKEIVIKAEKLTLENGSFYIWGYSYDINETTYLRLDRIKAIKLINLKENNKALNNKALEVKYKLAKNSTFLFVPSGYEIILEENDKEFFIQAQVSNKFKFIQGILSYGSSCTIISPESIKMEIIYKLKKMTEAYQDIYLT